MRSVSSLLLLLYYNPGSQPLTDGGGCILSVLCCVCR